MATNGKTGGGKRVGAVKVRPQVYDATTDRLTKAGAATGQIIEVKTTGKPLTSVRKNKAVKQKAAAGKAPIAGKNANQRAKKKRNTTPAKR